MPDSHRECRRKKAFFCFDGLCKSLHIRAGTFLLCLAIAVPRADLQAGEPPVKIKPGDELVWSVDPPNYFTAAMAWKGKVAPDGTLNLGAYGTVQVSGLTLEDAKAIIDRQILPAKQNQEPGPISKDALPPEIKPVVSVSPPISKSPDNLPVVSVSPPISKTSDNLQVDHPKSLLLPTLPSTPTTPIEVVSQNQPPENPQGLPITPCSGKLPDIGGGNGKITAPPNMVSEQAVPAPACPAGPSCPQPAPQECRKMSLPTYVIEPPDIILVESTQGLRDQPIRGQHLVRPDGTIGLGIYGSVHVAGLTVDQAREEIAKQIGLRVKDLDVHNIYVDILAYNSKAYYVITDGGGFGEQVFRLPVTGNETVLDALSQINGLPPVASKKHIWVARPCCTPQGFSNQVLPVDWLAIAQSGNPSTNYQVMPGDRIYVKADHWITFESKVSKVLAPFERMLGITLLGSETVNSIRLGNTGIGNGFGR